MEMAPPRPAPLAAATGPRAAAPPAGGRCGARRRAAPRRAPQRLLAPLLVLGGLLGPRGRAAFAEPPPRRGSAAGRRSALAGAGGALLALGGLAAGPGTAAARLTPQELQQVELFSRSSPSVLGISEGFTRLLQGMPAPSGATGSAFIWDDDHIVTNFHVIAHMTDPYATFLVTGPSGNEIRSIHKLVLVGGDPLSDIAVLQAPSLRDSEVHKLIRPMSRGSSSTLVPGQEVFALGNPYGLEHSMSRGIVSGVSRTMPMGMGGRPMGGVIQTDAAINPGNSGGPLLDSKGRVVGINSGILSSTGSFGGVGLAIPIDLVEQHVTKMLSNGYVSRAVLGVTFAPAAMSKALGVDGVMVKQVVRDSPASRAGLRALGNGHLGDIIASIEGKSIASSTDVVRVLDQLAPGQAVKVQLKRASQDIDSDRYDIVDLRIVLDSSGQKKYPLVAV
ncbi:unnamed protein product [Prorocentrum cordatum]|uniref:PDZ domain-containing protein n=1 Tax=Prorocentrum cordatum TaxID=2364126 RepID=A0ABN9W5X2_9DINO|nr:unnamed protein product [Polarella glacialis]